MKGKERKHNISTSHTMQFNGLQSRVSDAKDLQLFLQAVHNISATMNPITVASTIISECCKVLSCDRASLFMVDEDSLSLVIAKGAKNIVLPKHKGIAGYVATQGEAVNIPDAHLDERFDPSHDRKSGYRTKSVLAVPVRDIDGTLMAVIQAINKQGNTPFSSRDLVFLNNFSKHASVALNNAALYAKSLDAETKLNSLVDMVVTLHTQSNTSSLIFTLSHRTHQLVGADRCTLYLLDQTGQNLVVMQGDVDIRFPKTTGIAGFVATEGKVVNIPDCYKDERFNQAIDRKTGYRTKSMLCMPIFGTDKTTIGVLQVINKLDGSSFNAADTKLLAILLSVAGPVLETSALRASVKAHNTGQNGDKMPQIHSSLLGSKGLLGKSKFKTQAKKSPKTVHRRALSDLSE